MMAVLKYIWQLPQNILGLIVVCLCATFKENGIWYTWKFAGVSLGNYIIVYRGADKSVIAHERGHQRQSLILGPLYLLVIGLPSIIGNLICHIYPFNYYKQPWEAWADKLGGVKR